MAFLDDELISEATARMAAPPPSPDRPGGYSPVVENAPQDDVHKPGGLKAYLSNALKAYGDNVISTLSGRPNAYYRENYRQKVGMEQARDADNSTYHQALINNLNEDNSRARDEFKYLNEEIENPFNIPGQIAAKIRRRDIPNALTAQSNNLLQQLRESGLNNRLTTTESGKDRRFQLGMAQNWKKFLIGEEGKTKRAGMVQSRAGTFQATTDTAGNITGFYNTKNPNIRIDAPEGIGRKNAMSPEMAKNSENAASGLRALDKVEQMIAADPSVLYKASIPGPIAREFKAAVREASDVITRLRTGAALNMNEEEFYKGQLPGMWDAEDPEAVAYKIGMVRDLFGGMASKAGVNVTKPSEGRNTKGGGGGNGNSKTILVSGPKGTFEITSDKLRVFTKNGYKPVNPTGGK